MYAVSVVWGNGVFILCCNILVLLHVVFTFGFLSSHILSGLRTGLVLGRGDM